MSAQEKHFVLNLGELLDRVALCTGATHSMVKAYLETKTEVDGDLVMNMSEAPDYGADDGDELSQEAKLSDIWGLPRWETIEEGLRDTLKKDYIHPVDITSIVSKSDPIPIKNLGEYWLEHISKDGHYCGHNDIRKALS